MTPTTGSTRARCSRCPAAGAGSKVCFEHGYPAAQIFAPPAKPGEEAVICFEPVTAPTDALRRGGYRRAHPGRPAATRFSIRV